MLENADQSPAASARELGPCPWCGGTPAISKYQTDEDGNEAWAVACDCKRAPEDQPYTERYASAHGSTEAAAIAAWNACTVPAEPPAGAVELRAALADLNALVTKAQNILSAYLQPDGDTDEAVNSLLYLLDGPEQRQIQGAARDALAKTDGAANG